MAVVVDVVAVRWWRSYGRGCGGRGRSDRTRSLHIGGRQS